MDLTEILRRVQIWTPNCDVFKLDQKRKYKRFIHHLMQNLKEIPYPVTEFEYQVRLGHKRQNTYKIPAVFANLTLTK
jgi:hypothetical protein